MVLKVQKLIGTFFLKMVHSLTNMGDELKAEGQTALLLMLQVLVVFES